VLIALATCSPYCRARRFTAECLDSGLSWRKLVLRGFTQSYSDITSVSGPGLRDFSHYPRAHMAFAGQLDHWLYPTRWYGTVRPQTLPESQLVRIVEQRFAPNRVSSIHIAPDAKIAQLIISSCRIARESKLRSARTTGRFSAFKPRRPSTEAAPTLIHQFHLRLISSDRGKVAD
jgi:hypothetical protein